MSADFFNNDLLGTRRARRMETEDSGGDTIRSISDSALNTMARQKQAASSQMADAAKELEELRAKQAELEAQRGELEQLTKRQGEYEAGKREILERIERSLILVKREEVQAVRMAELLAEVRTRFKDTLAELKAIDEGSWGDDDFHAELNKAMTLVEEAKSEHRKALARIDAAGWHRELPPSANDMSAVERLPGPAARAGFGYWVKVGLAVTLPLTIAMGILFVAWLVATGYWPR